MSPAKQANKQYTWDEFFKLNFEHQKYVFMLGDTEKHKVDIKVVDNDEIFAMFQNERVLSLTLKHFFIRNTNRYYIVYDKVTKKVRSNTKRSHVLATAFIKHFFDSSIIKSNIFIPTQLSNTFIKKVVENKINTLKDVLQYIKSYVFKNKLIPDLIILNLNYCNPGYMNLNLFIPHIKNWDLFLDLNNCKKLMDLPVDMMKYVNYQINDVSDLSPFKIQMDYEDWKSKIRREING